MSVSHPTTGLTKLEKALERVVKGQRDPERMRKAIEQMHQSREETRKRTGVLDVAVDLAVITVLVPTSWKHVPRVLRNHGVVFGQILRGGNLSM